MATIQTNQTTDAIQQAHEQFSESLRRQAEQIDQLRHVLESLRNEQQQLEEVASRMIEPLTRSLTSDAASSALSPSGLLAGVNELASATDVEEVLATLAEEASRLGVRAAVLGIRGRVAWGVSASGFGPELSAKELRTVAVPLNQDGPFHQAFEMAEAVEARLADLIKYPSVLVKFVPAANARVALLPVRSADSVAAILYAETGENRDSSLIDSLKVLAKFAGAQLDRLTAIHGGFVAAESAATKEIERGSEQPVGDKIRAAEPPAAPAVLTPETVPAQAPLPPAETAPVSTALPEEPQTAVDAPNVTLSAEEEEKIHRDARRFSKLLVSEIELYNKSSVEEGRRNKDLYQRLKKDIERSRETYEKRFAHTVASQVDYFHEELVRTLAENDPILLGPAYPGPTA